MIAVWLTGQANHDPTLCRLEQRGIPTKLFHLQPVLATSGTVQICPWQVARREGHPEHLMPSSSQEAEMETKEKKYLMERE